MNFQHFQAVRQLRQHRTTNASLMHAGYGVGPHQLAQDMQLQFRNEEESFDVLLRSGYGALKNWQRDIIQNAMSTTIGSQGGYVAPTTIALGIADALSQYSSMRRVASVIVTERGEDTNHPSSDGRSETGELLGQSGASSLEDINFGSASINTFKFGSKVITVPIELIQDSSIDLVGFLERRIAARLGRITNAKFTTGNGATEPMGIVMAAPVGKVGATGQVATVSPDDLEELLHSVDAAYRESLQCGWMMRDSTLLAISKLKDGDGRPLNLVKYGSRAANEPTTLLGFPVETNPDMPIMAANAKPILFGDFSCYVVRDVASVIIYRMADSFFANKGQVGFLGVTRAGGNYVDAGNAIRAYQNSAS